MMLYVSLEQEKAVRNLFTSKGWGYRKPGKGYCKENRMQGCHGQGKMSGKRIFFQVREKSGNFVDGQRNLERT